MIFDNADVMSPPALEAYFPHGRKGNILITSRNSAMKTLTLAENSLEVTGMEEKDAIELLLKASCLESPKSDDQVEGFKTVRSSPVFLLLLIRQVFILLLEPPPLEITLQSIQSII